VPRGLFDSHDRATTAHVELADRADVFCIAPATANLLAKAAHGLADDLVSTLVLSFPGPILLAPAMNSDMWAKASVQRNLQVLRDDGFQIVEPGTGWLSCRKTGPGRMAEPEVILAAIEKAFGS
jgi:phosphopantothenoylcysteine decarboxylase/phosphopantothenate--cysteine ligase